MDQCQRYAEQAEEFLQRGDRKQALALYKCAVEASIRILEKEQDPARKLDYRKYVEFYLSKAESLAPKQSVPQIKPSQPKPIPSPAATSTGAPPEVYQRQLAAAKRVLIQAKEDHERLRALDARASYLAAAEMFMKIGSTPEEIQYCRSQATLALEAVEALDRYRKGVAPMPRPAAQPSQRTVTPPMLDLPSVPNTPLLDLPSVPTTRLPRSPSPDHPPSASPRPGDKMSSEEIEVIKFTSKINGKLYVPFFIEDLSEDFRPSTGLFVDPDGPLALSTKQQAVFAKWVRPSEVSSSPKMIVDITSKNIKQTVVPNCSFVSSLAISADFEKRFNKKIVTNCIFPQRQGQPIINPYGKYMVRLFVNGVMRKVIIDDFLPLGCSGDLLCAHSVDKNEMWMSLIEKAYLKIMGGYDFPGSNSGVDLHALSGWIPERLPLKEINDNDWDRVWRALHKGDLLATCATGPLSEVECTKTGLVPTHAYALLDIRKFDDIRLIKLKNPWNRNRWLGAYSPADSLHWTADLRSKLKYDTVAALQHDDGEFWIEAKALQSFFEVMYLNWNPELFPHSYVFHSCWQQSEGPVKDSYNLGYNPQYSFSVKGKETISVRVLLSRHITTIDDFANNKEYITLHAYKGGNRIFYPDDPILMGVKINSPHYLLKLELQPGEHLITFVVSQYEKSNTIRYSIRAWCSESFKLQTIPPPYPPNGEQKITSEWSMATAGGSTNDRESHEKNPKFSFVSVGDESVFIKLEAPKVYSVGLTIKAQGEDTIYSGPYRPGFCYKMFNAKKGIQYTVIPSTFNKGEAGAFFLTVGCKGKYSFAKMS